MSEATVDETYVAAIQHELVEFEGDEHLAGVVRRPTGWFRASVDENYPALGPPESLLSTVKEREEDFKMQGMCDEGAHNAAWDDTDFDRRYREYLEESEAAQSRLSSLAERVRDGQPVVLVCFEGDSKQCHRHHLVERLRERVSGSRGREN